MSSDRHSPPRKRARLSGPASPHADRRDDTIDVDSNSTTTAMDVDAQTSESSFLTQQQHRADGENEAGTATATVGDADVRRDGDVRATSSHSHLPVVDIVLRDPRFPSFLSISALMNPPVSTNNGEPQEDDGNDERDGRTGANPPGMNDHEDAHDEDEQVANATMMEPGMMEAHPASEESSSTDDEELQQLTMVTQDANVIVDMLNGEGGGEVKFEDLLHALFLAAKDAKLSSLQQCFRIIKKSRNPEEVMKRAVTAEDDTGLTLLMISVRNNLLPVTAFLLQEGADVNQCNVCHTSPCKRC